MLRRVGPPDLYRCCCRSVSTSRFHLGMGGGRSAIIFYSRHLFIDISLDGVLHQHHSNRCYSWSYFLGFPNRKAYPATGTYSTLQHYYLYFGRIGRCLLDLHFYLPRILQVQLLPIQTHLRVYRHADSGNNANFDDSPSRSGQGTRR